MRLTSPRAYQIWQNADENHRKIVESLPDVVYATKSHEPECGGPPGVLVYVRNADGTDSLVWVDDQGNSITQSQLSILRAAACTPPTPALPRQMKHHELVQQAVKLVAVEQSRIGGQLGRPSSARYKAYTRLKAHFEHLKQDAPILASGELERAIDDLHRYPLRQLAVDAINRQLRSNVTDDTLAEMVVSLRKERRLSIIEEEHQEQEPRIICSLGLAPGTEK